MSFPEYEESIYHGEPVDLFLFTYGDGASEYIGYCDAETTLVHDGKTYTPFPVDRDAINSSGSLDKSGLSLRVDITSAVAELFRVFPPTRPVVLVIKQGHIGDPDADFRVIWTGRVLSCSWEDSEAKLTCEPVSTSMQRIGLRRHYQYGCPHALYMGDEDGGCRANKAVATQATTVSAVSGSLVTLPSGWNGTRAKLKFIGGMIEWTNPAGSVERRAILKINEATNVVTMGGPIPAMTTGASVGVVLGCNHQMDDCATLHFVINDFGGDPWIPTKSPYGTAQNFY